MEEKLAEYRARKRKDEIFTSVLKKMNGLNPSPLATKHVSFAVEQESDSSKSLLDDLSIEDERDKFKTTKRNKEAMELDTSEQDFGCTRWSWLSIVSYSLYFLLWLTLFAIAVNIEFGAVYFIVSTLFLIWKNTRTGPKKRGEISAYSVFNPDCEAIEGTLKAEQFEREIRFGAASVH